MSDDLIAALAKAQAGFPAIVKSHTAKVPTKSGAEYSYTYANLAETLAAVIPTLTANGIVLLQPIITTADGLELQTVLCGHGDRITSSMPLRIDGMQPQAIGSLISYYRRYMLTSLLALAADDDDGAAAQNTPVRTKPAKRSEAPRLNAEQVLAVHDYFDGLPDDVRVARKQAFKLKFGTPEEVRASFWTDVALFMEAG